MVEDYWDSLTEYEGAILKAREIWDHIKPLYLKLHKYIALRLKGADEVGKPLSVSSLSKLYIFKSFSSHTYYEFYLNM